MDRQRVFQAEVRIALFLLIFLLVASSCTVRRLSAGDVEVAPGADIGLIVLAVGDHLDRPSCKRRHIDNKRVKERERGGEIAATRYKKE